MFLFAFYFFGASLGLLCRETHGKDESSSPSSFKMLLSWFHFVNDAAACVFGFLSFK